MKSISIARLKLEAGARTHHENDPEMKSISIARLKLKVSELRADGLSQPEMKSISIARLKRIKWPSIMKCAIDLK